MRNAKKKNKKRLQLLEAVIIKGKEKETLKSISYEHGHNILAVFRNLKFVNILTNPEFTISQVLEIG